MASIPGITLFITCHGFSGDRKHGRIIATVNVRRWRPWQSSEDKEQCFGPPDRMAVARKQFLNGLHWQKPSRRNNALLIATAASAPSAIATATSRTSRDKSPATYTPGTLVSSVCGSVTTPPFGPRSQPRISERSEAWRHPVEKNKPDRGRSGPP